MDAVVLECAQLRDQFVPICVERLVDVLQSLGGHRFDADERALDPRAEHGREELGILGCLHRDLREEDRVVRQFRQPFHQLEALVANGGQSVQRGRIRATGCHPEVRQRHRIEVVVRERDETEAEPAQLHDLLDDGVRRSLARLLAVSPPHGAEGAVLRTPADRLHRRPHVAVRRHQVPARGQELVTLDSTSVIDGLQLPALPVCQHLSPDGVAVTLRHCVRAADLERLVRVQRGVYPAEDDRRSGPAGCHPDLVAAQRVSGVDSDPDDIALLEGSGIDLRQRLIDDDRVAELGRGRGGDHVEPPRCDDPDAERDVTRIH